MFSFDSVTESTKFFLFLRETKIFQGKIQKKKKISRGISSCSKFKVISPRQLLLSSVSTANAVIESYVSCSVRFIYKTCNNAILFVNFSMRIALNTLFSLLKFVVALADSSLIKNANKYRKKSIRYTQQFSYFMNLFS